MKSSSNEDVESPFKSYPGPNNEYAKWLRLFWSKQLQLSISSRGAGGSFSLSWLNDERYAQKNTLLGTAKNFSEEDIVNNPPFRATFPFGFITSALVRQL